MTEERPYEMMHLPEMLRDEFSGKVPEAPSGNAQHKENNFLSRALAAYAVHKICGCSQDEAAECVVDGGADGGIDAVYFSANGSILWLIQSKFIQDGRGQPDLHSMTRFKTGVEQILQGDYSEIQKNSVWKSKLPILRNWLSTSGLRVRVIVVYSGVSVLAEDRIRLFEDLRQRFNHEDDFIEFKSYSLVSIHDWMTGADQGLGVEKVELEIIHPGWFKEPYETIYGKISITDLARLYRAYGQALIAANIRRYKGSSEVNKRIAATAKNEPENLFYFNNGLTGYCNRLEINNLDRTNKEKKAITAYGFCIVNGAQTIGSLNLAYPSPAQELNDGYVFIKIISLDRCEDDREFARRITECTNLQNQIGPKDFAAIDEQQERIATHLKLADIEYHYKDAEDVPDLGDKNFTIEHATIALACLDKDSEFNLCTRITSNRKSLWSFDYDPIYPETEIYRSRYERIFRPDYSVRTIWRSVQTYGLVLQVLQEEGRVAVGVRKAFYENSKWLILKILFVKVHPERGEEMMLPEGIKNNITAKAQEIGVMLWKCYEEQGFASGTPHARSVFNKPADCKRLYDATMAKLAQATNVAAVS